MTRVLRGEHLAFELDDKDLALEIGRLTFLLTAYRGDASGVLFSEDIGANIEAIRRLGLDALGYADSVPTISYIADRGTLLQPGESVSMGRVSGITIYDQSGRIDRQRHALYNWSPIEDVMSKNLRLSRKHAAVTVVTPTLVEIHDLHSTNGTKVIPRLPSEE